MLSALMIWWATTWGVKFEPIYWFIFHSIFIPNGGDGGQAGGEIWVYY